MAGAVRRTCGRRSGCRHPSGCLRSVGRVDRRHLHHRRLLRHHLRGYDCGCGSGCDCGCRRNGGVVLRSGVARRSLDFLSLMMNRTLVFLRFWFGRERRAQRTIVAGASMTDTPAPDGRLSVRGWGPSIEGRGLEIRVVGCAGAFPRSGGVKSRTGAVVRMPGRELAETSPHRAMDWPVWLKYGGW